MSEEDLKEIIAAYQKKSFELFNQNIVLETQISKVQRINAQLAGEIEELKKPKRKSKPEDEF